MTNKTITTTFPVVIGTLPVDFGTFPDSHMVGLIAE